MKVDEVTATFHFDENEFEVVSDNAKAVYEWSKLHRWRANDAYLLIYLHDTYYYTLPRRAFDDEQWAFVREQLEKHVKRIG